MKTNNKEIEVDLIIKSGATDLRRGAKQLLKDSITKLGNPNDGNIRAYANKTKTTIKLVQEKHEGITMITKKLNKAVEWPEYQPPDAKGHIIILKGKEKDNFLIERNCPKEL